jgi:hypothetical protein
MAIHRHTPDDKRVVNAGATLSRRFRPRELRELDARAPIPQA